ncbi:hypothetical protein, partial [Cylindrospermopsis raciborskii]|uniref:hypothetical protein n=1 Tax=Cylindrospermopsis raciborskii TaxID=77022 RepID=UPI0022C9F89A
MKSIVAQINLGFATIEGLMLPDGTYAVSVPQIAKLFSLDSAHAARDIKTLVKKNESFSLSNQEEQKQGKRSQERGSSLSNQQELFPLNTESDVTYSVVSQT